MWYEHDYRRIFMDMHLNDSNPTYLSKLDVESFVNSLAEADASSVVVKAKSHVGLHYWRSKYGRMHKTLERRNLDYVGEMIARCHEKNINVILYFSQIYDNYAYDKHRSWRINIASVASRNHFGNSRYGLVCPNNPHYKKYCAEILTELAENYDFEGIFLDMPFWPQLCYCSQCQKRYLKETGHFMPIIWNFGSKKWQRFVLQRQTWIDEFMAENTAALKKVKPQIAIEHNMAAIGLNWMQGNTEKNFVHSDYAGGDYYGGYLEQTFMCKYYNNMTTHKPFSYITSRCDNNLFFHTVSRTFQDLLIHSLTALVHNGAFSICDAMNPDGTITDKMYANEIKQVFAVTKKLERYVSGDIDSDVAIWYNTAYKVNPNFIKSPFNIAEILLENNIAFDVVGSKNLANLRAQALVINDAQEICDEEVAALADFVRRGGNIFITGALGNNKNMANLVGVDIKGASAYTYSYLTPTKAGSALLEDFDTSSPYPVEHTALETEITDKFMEILATLSYPYTLPNSRDFAAIHSNPPGIHTALPAITQRKLGAGRIIWCAAPLELTTAHNCKKAIAKLITSLISTREFTSNAPAFVEALKWKKGEKTYLSLINQQKSTPIYPINDIEIVLNGRYQGIKKVSDTAGDLAIGERDGNTVITVGRLEVFHIIEMQAAQK